MGQTKSSSSASADSNGAELCLEDWTGTWEATSRQQYDAFLEILGVPVLASGTSDIELHQYRVDSTGFTMNHQILASLFSSSGSGVISFRFRADLDNQWCDSPYPRRDTGRSKGDVHPLAWKSFWEEEPICFTSEHKDFLGLEGINVTVKRKLVSKSEISITTDVLDKGELKVSSSTTMRKAFSEGPSPVAWLRKEGGSLRTVEERCAALDQCIKMFSDPEGLQHIFEAQKRDRVQPPNFQGSANMLIGGAKHYQQLVPEWMKPEQLEDTCPPILKSGVEAEFKAVKEPKGVCIVIAPWNAPVTLAWVPMLGMIAAGNRVVIKPAEVTPNVAIVIRRLCHKYLPGLVWVEEGAREAAERLMDEGADHLVFTGSGEVGKLVMARCARTLTPVTLELGGKSPMFVDNGLSDAMLKDVVREILELKVYKTGQFCCAHDYALVHRDIFKSFCEHLRVAIEGLGENRNVIMIGQRHYESVKAKLDEALAGGASCLPPFDGTCKPNDSDMTLPFTALLETAASSSVLSTEIFGPILPIVQVDNVQEAIEMVRRVPTGTPLISYCYSSDAASAEAFEAGTSSGMLVVNGGPQRIQANYNVAFGGAGASGFGVHMWGRRALEEFSHTRHVCIAKDGGFAKSFFSGPPKPPSQ